MKKPIISDINFLRQKSEPVKQEEVKDLLQDLEDSLDLSKGIGLSAIQIGELKNIAIVRIKDTKINLINAYIIDKNDKFRMVGEGCLSLAGVRVDTRRYREITINNNNGIVEHYEGLLAVAIQHELSHCIGRTILDDKWRSI